MKRLTAAAAALLAISPLAQAKKMPPQEIAAADPVPYADIVADVANMVGGAEVQEAIAAKGLQLLNVLWEDTGRWEGSSVGPNISDVTIEVEADPTTHARYLMPVMRHDNFVDQTGDVKLDKIYLPVGNEDGDTLETISLRDLLAKPTKYLSLPKAGTITGGTLLAERDSHALVSAQHAFLPVPKDGKATFWPVIFNYQSTQDAPAVLAILVTRQGTSMTIIDNARDTVAGGASWGQRLYFNHDGKKAALTAERLKDVKRKGKTSNGESAESLGDDANLLMLIQVPLKIPESAGMAYGGESDEEVAYDQPSSKSSGTGAGSGSGRSRAPDVDVAVIGHGDDEGPYTELDDLTIERDDRFPVRVTVQFYQATSNGAVTTEDIDRMAAQIDAVYAKADYVGSLVVPKPSDKQRPTRSKQPTAPAIIDWSLFPGLAERWRHYRWI